MDLTTIAGIVLALGGILAGQALEGGHVGSILQGTAAIIIFTGTFGAVMVSFPTRDFIRGMKMFGMAFTDKKQDLAAVTRQIVDLAGLARRDGVLALESKLPEIEDPFLKKALTYVVDGVDATVTRSSLEAAIDAEHQENMVGAKPPAASHTLAPWLCS